MIKNILNFIIKFFIKRMKFTLKLINKFSFFSNLYKIYRFIQTSYIFKYLKYIILIVSIVSLIFNSMLFLIYAQYSDITFPALTWILALPSLLEYILPNFILDYFIWLKNYFYYLFKSVKDYIIRILKAIINYDEANEEIESIRKEIEEIKTKASINKSKDLEIQKDKSELEIRRAFDDARVEKEARELEALRKQYKFSEIEPSKFEEFRDKYLIYVVAGFFLLTSGALIYYYWTDLSNLFKEDKGPTTGDSATGGDNPSNTNISPSTDSTESLEGRPSYFYRYFR